ncbi:thiol:disulfide interchange protein DsbG [Methyloversatilis sp.]|uniref:thiol:disulfide interchange protein DsbG n=1 Tax=Methyloversatilis sp. TaxID=2569862 RepID=UPI002736A5EA|nr:thiol:disulfide interchange protein DsbG [Methyloversatilis sp.]MDP2867560.1 thiol:disulfide interchange protein DsbG [Methyloversatilis sp.]MDP3288873.1 thiol:disulfide interchange protein DsbG [Methyloversatilis sp.]MDP3456019.1 thiol:disulfide interchange protein DsbG [Methyloversatilis sp.]MDP3579767.1 thiol:disulfide interchange protein DsbG [Methyloversatilis sp.]
MNPANSASCPRLRSSAIVRSTTGALIIAFASAAASFAIAAPALPAALQALEKKGLTIVGTFPSPGGLTAYAAHAGTEPVALYVTPDGKHVIAGTLFDATGTNLTTARLEKVLAKPMTDAVWEQLEKSHWIADGRADAPRTVYVFTDPNCPYCNKLWADARPWVDAGKVQLRHIMVGILTPTSAAKAAALLGDRNPVAALDAYERGHVASTAKTLASGRPKPLGDESLKPLAVVPAALAVKLDANAALMAAYGLGATPAVVWKDAKGSVQMRQGAPESDLATIFGPR